jgi:hypothetical protein
MAIMEGMKSIPAGSHVKTVIDSTDVITVAASRYPTLKRPDLVLALGADLAKGHAPVPHLYGQSGAPEHDLVDRLASTAMQGQIGWAAWRGCTGRRPPRARP